MRPFQPPADAYPAPHTEIWPCPIDPTNPPAPLPGFTRPTDRYPFLVATRIVDLFTDPGDHIVDLTARNARTPAEAAAIPVAAALAGRRCTLTSSWRLGVDDYRRTAEALNIKRQELIKWRRGNERTILCDHADLLIIGDTRWRRRRGWRQYDRAVEQLGAAKGLLDLAGVIVLRLNPPARDHHTHLSIALNAAHDVGLACFAHIIAVPNPTRRTSVEATRHLHSHGTAAGQADTAAGMVHMLIFVEDTGR